MATPPKPAPKDDSIDPSGEFALDVPEQFFYLIYQIVRVRDQQFDGQLAPFDLTLGRWRSLTVIRRLQPCAMKDLSRYVATDRTTLTRSIDQLVAEGLVARTTPREDRRKVQLSLTAQGEAVYMQGLAVLRTLNRSLLADVSETDARVVARVMKTVICNLIPDKDEASAVIRFGDGEPV